MRKAMTQAMAVAAISGTQAFLVAPAGAQVSVLIADRTTPRIWIATDADRDGTIGAGELQPYFDATNLSGVTMADNPSALGYDRGLALIGDQDTITGRRWTWALDNNSDGDALDEGEAGVWADASNPGGYSFAFPTGVAFGLDGEIAMVNAGNGFGADDVFLVRDDTAAPDGDVNDAGEVTRWVALNGFGANGSFSPQEIAYDHAGVLYLRNSSANLHGVYRLRDTDGSGLIDQPSEMALFFGAGNASGITPSAGFDLCLDPVRARSFYGWQLATGGIDQLLRLQDVNNDGDAMDAGEAAMVYATSEAGFSSIDSVALSDGSVLISENSGSRVFRLTDLDGDGLFTSEGERAAFVGSGLAAARQVALVHDVGCNAADLGRVGGVLGGDAVLDNNDFVVFIDLFFAEAPAADVGRTGGVGPGDGRMDNNDFVVFIDLFFAGCP